MQTQARQVLLTWLSPPSTSIHPLFAISTRLTQLNFFPPNSPSETKAAVEHKGSGDLKMLKKKLKRKKKRLKEEVRLWVESRRRSDGQNDEPEAAEPPAKKNATENGNISKQGTGM